MVGRVLAGSCHGKGQKKQQVLGAGEGSWVVKAASTLPGRGQHRADGAGPGKDNAPLGFQPRVGVPPKCRFQQDPPRSPRAPAAPHPLSLSRLATSLPASVTSHNIFGSSCRRRGRCLALSLLPAQECGADLSSDTRDFRRSCSPEIWDGDSCSAEMGPGQRLPLQPHPRQPGALHGHVSVCWGLGTGLRSSPWAAMGDGVLRPSPAGVGAAVAGPADSTRLTHMWLFPQFGFTGGLGG